MKELLPRTLKELMVNKEILMMEVYRVLLMMMTHLEQDKGLV